MILHLISLISEKRKMKKIYRIQFKEHTKTHDRTKIKVYSCATDDVPPCDIRDELSIPELHLYHPNHQLIPGNSSYNHHQPPSLSRKRTTEIIKNLPKANTPQQPPTSPEPTQPRGLDEVLISELRELRKLRMDPSKARNLRSTISIIHFAKRLEDTLYKETENTDSTTPSQEDKT